MALGSTQPLTEMGKGGRCVWLKTLPPTCADCLETSVSWHPNGLHRDGFTFTFAKRSQFISPDFAAGPGRLHYWKLAEFWKQISAQAECSCHSHINPAFNFAPAYEYWDYTVLKRERKSTF
jgi:hypothetical protein